MPERGAAGSSKVISPRTASIGEMLRSNWTWGERGSASAASVWFFLTPPLGLLAGAWLLDEPLNWFHFIGIVPVVLGIVLVTRAR